MNTFIEIETNQGDKTIINIQNWVLYCKHSNGIELIIDGGSALYNSYGGYGAHPIKFEPSDRNGGDGLIKLKYEEQVTQLIREVTPRPLQIESTIVNPKCVSGIRLVPKDGLRVHFLSDYIEWACGKSRYDEVLQQMREPALLIPE